LWEAVPNADQLANSSLAALCSRAAELACQVGSSPRSVELARRAIELTGAHDAHRAGLLQVHLGEYLFESGSDEAALAELRRAADMVPAEPPSAERAYALGSLAGMLMTAWRHTESLPIGEVALRLAREVGAGEAEVRALTVLGSDLAYLDRGEEGLAHFRRALHLADTIGDHWGLERVYTNLTHALTMLGRPDESAQQGLAGLDVLRRYGIESALLAANTTEALIASGRWSEADRLSTRSLRSISDSFRSLLHMHRADLDLGRGEVEPTRQHLAAALATLRPERRRGIYEIHIAKLALYEHRWLDADNAVRDALALARLHHSHHLCVWFCATGIRVQAERAALARARQDADAAQSSVDRSRELLDGARRAAAQSLAKTPNSDAWLAMAEAEYARARGAQRPELWSAAAEAWESVRRPPLAAYCRRHEAEAFLGAGLSRAEAGVPLRRAHTIATQLAAKPLLGEIELLAQRARIALAVPESSVRTQTPNIMEILGLTARETEVLDLLARGHTNREIAATLVISVRTAGIHVSHILQKLGVPNRFEAAAIAHRLAASPNLSVDGQTTAPD
jgi:DNA-binding CsgD family transcriptional regulator/tetratricopeptide (TPR) repeat protein